MVSDAPSQPYFSRARRRRRADGKPRIRYGPKRSDPSALWAWRRHVARVPLWASGPTGMPRASGMAERNRQSESSTFCHRQFGGLVHVLFRCFILQYAKVPDNPTLGTKPGRAKTAGPVRPIPLTVAGIRPNAAFTAPAITLMEGPARVFGSIATIHVNSVAVRFDAILGET